MAEGDYPFDCWRADTHYDVSLGSGLVTIQSGTLSQSVENLGLAGADVVISIEDADGEVVVSAGGMAITIPADQSGHLELSLTANGGPTSIRRIKLERGRHANGCDLMG